jgi:hypothetical protein
VNKAKNKALAYTEKTVQGTYITEENTREAKEIKHFNKKSATSVTNQATS